MSNLCWRLAEEAYFFIQDSSSGRSIGNPTGRRLHVWRPTEPHILQMAMWCGRFGWKRKAWFVPLWHVFIVRFLVTEWLSNFLVFVSHRRLGRATRHDLHSGTAKCRRQIGKIGCWRVASRSSQWNSRRKHRSFPPASCISALDMFADRVLPRWFVDLGHWKNLFVAFSPGN